MKLSHLDATGRPQMVDVGGKPESERVAEAEGQIVMSPEALEAVKSSSGPKGNVLTTAELAGTMGAKKTAELVPLCHPLSLSYVEVRTEIDENLPGVRVRSIVKTVGRTGVEMEALTAVSTALLTVYDMVKALDRGMRIADVRLVHKSGGTHGDWRRTG